MNKIRFFLFLTGCIVLLSMQAASQENPLRLLPFSSSGISLNQQILNDSISNGGFVANRVYVLQRGASYRVDGIIRNYGWTLRIRANDSTSVKKATIFLYPTATGVPPGQMIDIRGDVILKNLLISGYFEPIDSNLNNLQGSLFNTGSAGQSLYIDSCILTNTNGNHIRTDNAPKTVKVTNTIFSNMGFLGKSNFGAGKGLDVRAGSVDSLIIQNCTFVNFYDRVIRHFSSTANIKHFVFDHNTVLNGASYHGTLSLGKVIGQVQITNNLLYDHFAMGNDTDFTRQVEFSDSKEKDPFGGNRMTWVIAVPNDTANFIIRNNYYAVSDSGQAIFNRYASKGVTGEGAPLTWYINKRLGADSVNAFKKLAAGFTMNSIPGNLNRLVDWYRDPDGGNKTKNTPTSKWNKSFDFDRKSYTWIRDTLNCKYSTSSPAYTGADGGLPVGSLNWWGISTSVKMIDLQPKAFSLEQNYPNPFNPSTTIKYQVPVNGLVSLKVFNIIGQEVATLVNEVQNVSAYEATFDASRLSSGIYFYTLRSGNFVETKKMMLLK